MGSPTKVFQVPMAGAQYDLKTGDQKFALGTTNRLPGGHTAIYVQFGGAVAANAGVQFVEGTWVATTQGTSPVWFNNGVAANAGDYGWIFDGTAA